MEDDAKTILRKKLQYYFDSKVKIHIVLESKWFYNGTIKEIGSDFIIFDDKKMKGILIHFSEVLHVEPCSEEDYDNKTGNYGGGYQP